MSLAHTLADTRATLQESNAKLRQSLASHNEQMDLLCQIADQMDQLRTENERLKHQLAATEASLPWSTDREQNDARTALGQIYRCKIGPDGGLPEIGVVDVNRARAALVHAYADVNAMRDKLEEAFQVEEELRRRIDCLTMVAEDGVKAMREHGHPNIADLEGVIARCRNQTQEVPHVV